MDRKMTLNVLQFKFPFSGPWGAGADLAAASRELAGDIAEEQGLIWKIWLENKATGMAGGTYLFSDGASAAAYHAMHQERLADLGLEDVITDVFQVNLELSVATKALFGPGAGQVRRASSDAVAGLAGGWA
jgi:hypothetical protein